MMMTTTIIMIITMAIILLVVPSMVNWGPQEIIITQNKKGEAIKIDNNR